MRHSVWLDLSLPYIKYYLEVVNVMVIFVWLVPYSMCVPYRLPYGFTLQYTVSLRPSGLSPSLGLPSALVAP